MAFRQFSSACLMDCSAVILMHRPTFPCVVRAASVTLQLLKFCAEKLLVFRQFLSACEMDCSAVILRPRLKFPSVFPMRQRRSGIVTLSRRTYTDHTQIKHPKIRLFISGRYTLTTSVKGKDSTDGIDFREPNSVNNQWASTLCNTIILLPKNDRSASNSRQPAKWIALLSS